jgi:ParB-like chromosome segregation protein Spo0J
VPGAFVIRGMASAGELDAAETEQLLLESGWPPVLAGKAARRWTAKTAAADKEATKTELLDDFAGGYLSEAELRAALEPLGYTGHEQDLIVHLGDARRIKRHREKVVDAIGKAYVGGAIDTATVQSELAEINVTGEAASMLSALWDKQRRFAAAAKH